MSPLGELEQHENWFDIMEQDYIDQSKKKLRPALPLEEALEQLLGDD